MEKKMSILNKLLNELTTILLCLFVFGAAHAQDADIVVATSIDRTQIGANQRFELTVEISGKDANAAGQPELPDMEAFSAYSGSSTSQSIQIINGSMSVTKGYTYYFLAREVGSFTIGPVEVKFKGQTFKSKPIEIEIVKSASQAQGQQQQSPRSNGQPQASNDLAADLFLTASVDRKIVYQNEPVIVDYKLYFRPQVTNYAFSNQPNYGDFWAEEFPGLDQPQVSSEMVNGVQFRVATVKKVALFATSAGKKTIPSLQMEVSVRMRERRGRRDIFDSFFDDPFFGRNVAHPVASDPITIEVVPLPAEGRPADFSGAVGRYNISARVDRTAAKTNEAVTLQVTVAGLGNIKILPKPSIVFPNAFEVYDPKISDKMNRANNQISGSKTFEYVLIPRRAGKFEFPSVRFSYFDPQLKKYSTASTKPIPFTIEQGDKVAASIGRGFSKEEVKLLGEDIRYIEKVVGSFSDVYSKFYNNAAVWVVLLAPLALLLTSFFYRTHQDRLSTNIAYARSRKAQKVAQGQLKDAKRAMDSGEVSKFYTESANALTKFVGNKLNLDEAALVSDELATKLQERGIVKAQVDEYQKLLSECDFRRFAMPDAPEEAMKSFYEKVRNTLAGMERAL